VNFGVTVESVEPARETPPETCRTSTPIAGPASRTLRPTVRLRTGEILHADVIIGADGRRSRVRRVVTEEDEEPKATSYGISHYTGSVPMTEIRDYAPLKQVLDRPSWPIWFGHSRGSIGTSSSFYPGNGPSFANWSFWESSISRGESGYRSGNGREITISGSSFTATASGIRCPCMVGR
jgi:hypothetical protein